MLQVEGNDRSCPPLYISFCCDQEDHHLCGRSSNKKKRRTVSFADKVRVHSGRVLTPEESDLPRSTFWYSRSEYRRMRKEIAEVSKILRRRSSIGSRESTIGVDSIDEEDGTCCIRGVEHLVFPELTERKKMLQESLFSLLRNGCTVEEAQYMENGTGSHHDHQTCALAIQSKTRESAIEAMKRALRDAEFILQNDMALR